MENESVSRTEKETKITQSKSHSRAKSKKDVASKSSSNRSKTSKQVSAVSNDEKIAVLKGENYLRNPSSRAFSEQVEGDLEDVLNGLNYENVINEDCCLQGGADSDSVGALSALI